MLNLCFGNFFEHHKCKVIRTCWQNNNFYIGALLSLFFLNACNVTQSLKEGENLLTSNKLSIVEKIPNSSTLKEEALNLIVQKPNKKMFGVIPFRVGIYNLSYDKKENKFRWWLKNKVGEAPVVFNNKISEKSAENIRLFMYNKGYLNAEVSFQSTFENKKAKVKYAINPGEQFSIQKISLPDSGDLLINHILQVQNKTLLHTNDAFDINILELERKRITDHLRNMGYYEFRKDYVVFELDSSNSKKTIDIELIIKAPTVDTWHKKYTINEVYIFTNYSSTNQDSLELDTLVFENFTFIETQKKFKPKVIANGIFFEKNEYFRLDSYQSTLRKLANFGSFKFVDIQFTPLEKNNKKYIDVYVYLTAAKKQTVSIDLEANHNFIGLTGSSIGFTYQNKNLSKSSDLFEFKVSSGVEFNVVRKDKDISILNNADVVIETNYYLNKFLLPFPLKKVSKYNNVKTRFSLQYNFERRVQFYSLHSNIFNFGYEWNESSNKKHLYNPISASLFILPEKNITEIFQNRLDEIPSLKRSFEEQFILGSNYTFFFNNKKTESDRSYFLFQGKVAMAGNIVHAITALTKQAKNGSRPFSILNREYAQFARFEGNIVHNFQIGKHASLNSRFISGIIIPYGNSTTAPYFQQFYVGGSNSIRAFRLRALGPGNYVNEDNFNNPNFFFDQSGDFKLEANTELRFDLYKWFKAAVFLDAGNVWLLRNDPARTGGTLSKNNFLQSIALGTGLGLRLDFDYFVIRTDFSFPLVDPRFTDDRRYPLNDFTLSFGKNSWFREHSIFHLAIGYPF